MNWRSANLRGSPEDSRFARQPCRDSGEWNRVERPFLKLATSTRVLQSGQKQYNPLNPTERAKKMMHCSSMFRSVSIHKTSSNKHLRKNICETLKKEMLWRLIERRHSTEEGQERQSRSEYNSLVISLQLQTFIPMILCDINILRYKR